MQGPVMPDDRGPASPSSEIMVLQQAGLSSAWSAAVIQQRENQEFHAWRSDNGRKCRRSSSICSSTALEITAREAGWCCDEGC
jgi:hypothetical protein